MDEVVDRDENKQASVACDDKEVTEFSSCSRGKNALCDAGRGVHYEGEDDKVLVSKGSLVVFSS